MNTDALIQYLRVPWIPGGREMNGSDCWGLVRLVLMREFAIKMPRYDYRDVELCARDQTRWEAVVRMYARPGDVAIMRRDGQPKHVGIFVDREKVLHMDPAGARCEDYRVLEITSPITAVYRPIP